MLLQLHECTSTSKNLSLVDVFRSLVGGLDRCRAEVQPETGDLRECEAFFVTHASAMLLPTLCDSYKRAGGCGDILLALRKLPSRDASANEQQSLEGLPC